MVKCLPAMWETWVQSLGWEDLLEKEMTMHSSILAWRITGQGLDLDNCVTEWFALKTNRDHSVVFETSSKYCISDSFVDHNGYSISFKGFLPTVVAIMVI